MLFCGAPHFYEEKSEFGYIFLVFGYTFQVFEHIFQVFGHTFKFFGTLSKFVDRASKFLVSKISVLVAKSFWRFSRVQYKLPQCDQFLIYTTYTSEINQPIQKNSQNYTVTLRY